MRSKVAEGTITIAGKATVGKSIDKFAGILATLDYELRVLGDYFDSASAMDEFEENGTVTLDLIQTEGYRNYDLQEEFQKLADLKGVKVTHLDAIEMSDEPGWDDAFHFTLKNGKVEKKSGKIITTIKWD